MDGFAIKLHPIHSKLQPVWLQIDFERLTLSKIGEIPIKLQRPIEGKIKGVIAKRTKTGKWFARVR